MKQLIKKLLDIDKIENRLKIMDISNEGSISSFINLLIKLKITPEEFIEELDTKKIDDYNKKLNELLVNKLILGASDRKKLDVLLELKEKLLD